MPVRPFRTLIMSRVLRRRPFGAHAFFSRRRSCCLLCESFPGTQRRIALERLYNSGMSPEIAARLRMDAPVLVIGIIVSFIGIGALFMHALRGRRTGHLLLWFSAFSILYGVRIVLDSVFA